MKEMMRQNDTENERNSKAGGKGTTVIRVKITSAGRVNREHRHRTPRNKAEGL